MTAGGEGRDLADPSSAAIVTVPARAALSADGAAVTRASTRTAAPLESEVRRAWLRRRRLIVPARVRIMAWLVLLLFVALVTVVVVTRNLLVAGAERDATQALEQETGEFRRVAETGRDSSTQRPFTSGRDLLENHVRGQLAAEHEILIGVAADGEILP